MLKVLESIKPRPTPKRLEAVNCDTLLPEMSPMLLFFENYIFIEALEAEARRKQMFLPTLAKEASKRK